MKKLLTVAVVFVIFLCLAVVETVYTDKTYKTIAGELSALSVQLSDETVAVSAPENLERLNAVEAAWGRGGAVKYMFTHHAVVRAMDERIASLRIWLELNNREEARVAATVCLSLADDLRDETFLSWANLF